MELLAQDAFTSMPGASVAIWMGIAAAALFLWNQANEALDRRKEQPPPSQTYAKEVDCQKRHDTAVKLALDVRAEQKTTDFEQDKAFTAYRAEFYRIVKEGDQSVRGELAEAQRENRHTFEGVNESIAEVLGAVRELKGAFDQWKGRQS